jgi:UDP-3-O-[3-hydroxymyristoyl] glucosamine N-acyltransferase
MKLGEIAALLDGQTIGDPELEIKGVSGISDAQEGEITFLSEAKWLKALRDSKASAVILDKKIDDLEKPQVIVKNPLYCFARLLAVFYPKSHLFQGLSSSAFISDKAVLGDRVTVYPFAFISDDVRVGSGSIIYPNVFIGEKAFIGDNCIIYPNAVIHHGITIGRGVIIHSGAVIGSDGFGYAHEGGVFHKIPQIGTVIIEDDVEIGANTTIDRATTGATIIGKGTKIDNLVQIGHNVTIGKNAILVSQTGIGGSSDIGDGVMLGGQVGVADHVTIESGTMIAAKAGVMGKVSRGIYSGAPAIAHKDWFKAVAIFNKLPELKKKVDELEEKINQMNKLSGNV